MRKYISLGKIVEIACVGKNPRSQATSTPVSKGPWIILADKEGSSIQGLLLDDGREIALSSASFTTFKNVVKDAICELPYHYQRIVLKELSTL